MAANTMKSETDASFFMVDDPSKVSAISTLSGPQCAANRQKVRIPEQVSL
jgi:hypothetical protein